ncbi:hypothetical protein [Microvirga sesbaniae]|uniref:hypothetical protein n=1 Tax=Microvirga sesbaniae TaxID=681392 RepID=UPI0021CA1816|nr:hypothetical protein [Microvirga sp. HBU67692]
MPEDQPAPAFRESEQWQAAGQLVEADPMPVGFDREAARIGVRLNGFYLFVAFSPFQRLRSGRGLPAVAAHSQSLGLIRPDALQAPLENRKNPSYHR